MALREEEAGSGRYRGTLVLPDGVESDGLLLEAFLADDRGEVARWVDPLGAIRVATLPPPAVARPQAEAGDGRVELAWSEPAARDLAGFGVLRSREPLQGDQVAGETQGTAFRDQGLQNGETYYYKVFALDRAGNEGEPSDRVAAVPVAPGPRSVRGGS